MHLTMDRIISFLKKLFVIALIISVAVLAFFMFGYYSDGTRAGVPMKISKRGVIFKTYEGQLNVGGITNTNTGAIPTVWDFSVTNQGDSVIQELNRAIDEGKRVKIYYKEKYMKFFWQGDTKYFAYQIEVLD